MQNGQKIKKKLDTLLEREGENTMTFWKEMKNKKWSRCLWGICEVIINIRKTKKGEI